jgi:formiminotetrahydrofolate cyclodeaminase
MGRDETIEHFLARLADPAAAPAGGAVAASTAAQAAALLRMSARIAGSDTRPEVDEIATAADGLLARALDAADAEESAVERLRAAYATVDDGTGSRRQAVRQALADAAQPQLHVVELAHEIVGLAARLVPAVSRSLAPDVAAAAVAAQAAATISRLNVEADLAGLAADDERRRLADQLPDEEPLREQVETLCESVRQEVAA